MLNNQAITSEINFHLSKHAWEKDQPHVWESGSKILGNNSNFKPKISESLLIRQLKYTLKYEWKINSVAPF